MMSVAMVTSDCPHRQMTTCSNARMRSASVAMHSSGNGSGCQSMEAPAMAAIIAAQGLAHDDGRAILALLGAGYSSREVSAHLDEALALAGLRQMARAA